MIKRGSGTSARIAGTRQRRGRGYTVATAVAVPTLTQWAVLALGILLGLAGFLAIRRRGGTDAIL
jgi:hypothetical protein